MQWHLERVGFDRRREIVSGAAGWITTIRERTRAHARWEDVTDQTKEAWALLLEHNAIDLGWAKLGWSDLPTIDL